MLLFNSDAFYSWSPKSTIPRHVASFFEKCEGTHQKTLDKQKKRGGQLSWFKKILIRGENNVACLKPITNFHCSFPHLNSLKILQGLQKVGGWATPWSFTVLYVNFILKKYLLQQKVGKLPPPPQCCVPGSRNILCTKRLAPAIYDKGIHENI